MVPEVEQFVEFESLIAHYIFLDVDLQPLTTLLEVSKSGLAHQPDGHDPPGNPHINPRILQLLGSLFRVVTKNLGNRVGELVLARVCLLTQGFDLFQLFPPQFVDFFVECQRFLL